ncbi:DNA polymerase III, chi subunit [Granulibacter bethesdensis CGDNIH4]|nr:DNA polymerase III, chi subunit [Granulibacter bethesdensis CGDNIH4]
MADARYQPRGKRRCRIWRAPARPSGRRVLRRLMTKIGFYHLTRTGPEQALPQLLGRTLAAGERAMVLCGGPERVAALDTTLWLCPNPDWLPHGTARSGDAALQPIWLTAQDEAAPNGARFLFLIDGTASERLHDYTRVFDLFDGSNEDAVAAARLRWKQAQSAGHTLTYWQQGLRGWEKKR